jgi:hypothetical protein
MCGAVRQNPPGYTDENGAGHAPTPVGGHADQVAAAGTGRVDDLGGEGTRIVAELPLRPKAGPVAPPPAGSQ